MTRRAIVKVDTYAIMSIESILNDNIHMAVYKPAPLVGSLTPTPLN